MAASRKIGIVLIILAVIMLIIGASVFTYRGSYINPVLSNLGKYSFLFWFPILVMGLVFVFLEKTNK